MNKRRYGLIACLCAMALSLQGCAGNADTKVPGQAPQATVKNGGLGTDSGAALSWPRDKLEIGEGGTPALRVYETERGSVESMDIETYVAGVLAGEMKNTWPIEALKAQAILARTFVLKFVEEKESRYPGADVSTDIEEAQAYNAQAVNDRIHQAVEETRGLVLNAGGSLPYAWFHAHSGGMTERAKEGLNWEKEEPAYTQVTESREPENVAEEADAKALRQAAQWEASFSPAEFAAACQKQGAKVSVNGDTALEITRRGDSGRTVMISADGKALNAAELRLALGSTKMRSTMLTSLKMQDGKVFMAGKGYGHGVGMSQWGAYRMAEEGKTAEEIVGHYFRNVTVSRVWE